MTNVLQQPWRKSVLTGAMFAGLVFAAIGAPPSAATTNQVPEFYLALGGSGSVGVQPTTAVPRGQPTNRGYANDLLDMERTSSPDLRLVKLGCPGETTITMLAGGAHCHYRSGSELSAALAFLHRHPSTVLVTLDLGFNNVRACMAHHVVNQPCVSEALAVVKLQLTSILTQLRSAAPPGMRIIGVGHYDPYLGDYLKGAAGRTFASQSLDVITRLNDALRSTYAAAGVPMADVGAAFDSSDTDPTTLAGVGTVPEDVARTCALTWMCTPAPLGPNPHPNDAGYHAIAEAISQVIVAEGPLH